MISKSTLKNAAEQNIISPDQIDPLYHFIQNEKINPALNNTDEPLKFVRSFGDVFIALGIILLITSVNMSSLSGYQYLIPAAGFILMAEWLIRARRLVLPGMVILIGLLFFIHHAFMSNSVLNTDAYFSSSTLSLSIIALSCLLFYFRYKMPFSLLPLAGSLVALTIMQIGENILEHSIIFFVMGFIIFCIAMAFDSRDTKRESHLSDSAFWLHLIASPLMVHGAMFTLLTGESSELVAAYKDIIMLAFFAIFFLIALFVDRRAMLVSTQLYAIYALTQLFQNDFIGSEKTIIYVLMTLAMLVIFFGTYWYKTRRLLFGVFANSKLSTWVPDLNIQDIKK